MHHFKQNCWPNGGNILTFCLSLVKSWCDHLLGSSLVGVASVYMFSAGKTFLLWSNAPDKARMWGSFWPLLVNKLSMSMSMFELHAQPKCVCPILSEVFFSNLIGFLLWHCKKEISERQWMYVLHKNCISSPLSGKIWQTDSNDKVTQILDTNIMENFILLYFTKGTIVVKVYLTGVNGGQI